MALFDIKAAETAAQAELQAEAVKKATGAIKAKLQAISAAEAVVANLRREYEVLLKAIASE